MIIFITEISLHRITLFVRQKLKNSKNDAPNSLLSQQSTFQWCAAKYYHSFLFVMFTMFYWCYKRRFCSLRE